VKRRKPRDERKEDLVRIRVTAEQKRILTEAAKNDGQSLSPWLLFQGLKAAKAGSSPGRS
jgi:uncharacterized protein (DUF1778 family)